MDRDMRGRFLPGNRLAVEGWRGLVAKRFDGNEGLAKSWFGRLGAHAYAMQAVGGTSLESTTPYKHPGSPEDFMRCHHTKDVSFGAGVW